MLSNEAKSIFTESNLGWLLWPESPTRDIKKIFRPIQQVSLTSHRRHDQRYCQSSSAFNNNYAALSYDWARIEQFQPVSDNYEDLTQTDALHKMKTKPPAVINDALHVCKSLSLQYIWMDSLCIVQDNLSHKVEQIAHMNMIYESAHLTIVAAAGSMPTLGCLDCMRNLLELLHMQIYVQYAVCYSKSFHCPSYGCHQLQ
jgi:hypothetical protein